MQPTPLKKYRIPGYPTRLEVLEEPELLERHLPPGWRATAEMASVAALFLAANGCSRAEPPSRPPQPKPGIVAPVPEPAKPEPSIVAPIFEHGEGRGVYGCMAMTPPIFLSEEQAIQVIAEQLSQAGIDVAKRNVALNGVTIPPLALEPQERRWEARFRNVEGEFPELEAEIRQVPIKANVKANVLIVDILDKKHKIGVEYVSESDYFNLGGSRGPSSIQDYRFKEVAGDVAQQLRKQGKDIYFGVFYDPCAPLDRKDKATESKRLLRLQVKDFIDWLKGQGVI